MLRKTVVHCLSLFLSQALHMHADTDIPPRLAFATYNFELVAHKVRQEEVSIRAN